MAKKKRVLIIDDEKAVRLLIAKLAERQGAEVVTAGCLAEVEQALERIGGFDLVILDLLLPNISGWDILSRIGQNSSGQRVPVIILTGAPLSGQEKDKLLGKTEAVVAKESFEIEAFSKVLACWLE